MSKAAKVEVYYSPTCGYCHRAKRLLDKKGVKYKEYNVLIKPAMRKEMISRTGKTSVPQIIINDKPIGGSDDLMELDFDGELDALLGIG